MRENRECIIESEREWIIVYISCASEFFEDLMCCDYKFDQWLINIINTKKKYF